jgi:uncharacterized protein
MDSQIGLFNKLKVNRILNQGAYLDSDFGEILLPKKFVSSELKIDDEIDVFIYNDSEDRLIATTEEPYAERDQFACLEVKDVVPFGAFLDWGLSKDLLLPKNQMHQPLYSGDKCVVRVCIDEESNRLYATSKITKFLEAECTEFESGDEVEVLVYEFTDLGASVIVDGDFRGVVHKSDMIKDIQVGDMLSLYVKSFTEDSRMNLAFRKPGFKGVLDSKDQIIDVLINGDGFLELHDKSSPEAIREKLQMSKKTYKEAIGRLYKDGRIKILKDRIQLK